MSAIGSCLFAIASDADSPAFHQWTKISLLNDDHQGTLQIGVVGNRNLARNRMWEITSEKSASIRQPHWRRHLPVKRTSRGNESPVATVGPKSSCGKSVNGP